MLPTFDSGIAQWLSPEEGGERWCDVGGDLNDALHGSSEFDGIESLGQQIDSCDDLSDTLFGDLVEQRCVAEVLIEVVEFFQ